jgi:hypothetical protein
MADFSRLAEVFGRVALEQHADRDGLRGLRRAVFLARGSHAPGEHCPTAPAISPHMYFCPWPERECVCGVAAESRPTSP